MSITIPEQIDRAIAAARRIRREAEGLNAEAGTIPVTRLTRAMTTMQAGFEDAMTALGALRTQLTDDQIAARREFAEDLAPPLADPVGTLGTPEAPGPLLQAGGAVRMAFHQTVLPGLGAVDQGDGTWLIPSERWNTGTARTDGPRGLAQAEWKAVKDQLPALITELRAFG